MILTDPQYNTCAVAGCNNQTYYTYGHLCADHEQEFLETKADIKADMQREERVFKDDSAN
jgi:hypothetical protein